MCANVMAAQFVHLAEHRDSNYAFADWNLRLSLARPGPAPGLGTLAPAGPLPKRERLPSW